MFVWTTAILLALLTGESVAAPAPHNLGKRYTNSVIRSYRTNTCLTLPANTAAANGVYLTVGDCATATRWDINPGSGSVIVSGTNFALDAGLDPHNNVPAKVWQSYPGATQQTWYLTGDNRIAITGGNQCLDEGDNGPQTYQCTPGNTNQVWYVGSSSPPPASSSVAPPPASSSVSSAAPSSAPSSSPPAGQHLKWNSKENLCATVAGNPADGTQVNMMGCDASSTRQRWSKVGGNIQLTGTNYCLDAGSNPANGVTMKVWTCYQGLSQQTFINPSGVAGLFQTANNQCLDVDNGNNVHLQTWACSQPDPQQQFILA